jgi:hypothetical protein
VVGQAWQPHNPDGGDAEVDEPRPEGEIAEVNEPDLKEKTTMCPKSPPTLLAQKAKMPRSMSPDLKAKTPRTITPVATIEVARVRALSPKRSTLLGFSKRWYVHRCCRLFSVSPYS